MTNVKIMVGDVLARLGDLPDRSVHCCVTSPPYWGLRDYGTASWDGGDPECNHQETRGGTGASSSKQVTSGGTQGYQFKDVCGKCGAQRVDKQIGLEPTVEEYIEKLTAVFAEVWRVLRDDGTLWLNMGDCYFSGPSGGRDPERWPKQSRNNHKPSHNRIPRKGKDCDPKRGAAANGQPKHFAGGNAKDLVGQPWRLAFALQAAGWYLRKDIIWHKPNPMPESCTDRPTTSHEYVFLMTKRPRYFYDAEAVKEAATHAGKTVKLGPKSLSKGQAAGRGVSASGNGKADSVLVGDKRNLRDVWKIATQSFPQAHFAPFPQELPRKCILAGTSEKGCCPECGAPVVRVVEKTRTFESGSGKSGNAPSGKNGPSLQGGGETGDIRRGPCVSSETTGWKTTCTCKIEPSEPRIVHETTDAQSGGSCWAISDTGLVPCTVLDPFGGAGTTALVASKMGRNAILTELSPKYANMAADRIRRECGLLATVTVEELTAEKMAT